MKFFTSLVDDRLQQYLPYLNKYLEYYKRAVEKNLSDFHNKLQECNYHRAFEDLLQLGLEELNNYPTGSSKESIRDRLNKIFQDNNISSQSQVADLCRQVISTIRCTFLPDSKASIANYLTSQVEKYEKYNAQKKIEPEEIKDEIKKKNIEKDLIKDLIVIVQKIKKKIELDLENQKTDSSLNPKR